MDQVGLLKISAYVTRGNGKAKLIISFNDKSLTDGQCALLAIGYLEHVLKAPEIIKDAILVDATYDADSGDVQ